MLLHIRECNHITHTRTVYVSETCLASKVLFVLRPTNFTLLLLRQLLRFLRYFQKLRMCKVNFNTWFSFISLFYRSPVNLPLSFSFFAW